jgi:hypothetical protein
MKVTPLHTIYFYFLFIFLELVSQPFLFINEIRILIKTKKIQLNIFCFLSNYKTDQLMQKLLLNRNCMIRSRKSYFFNSQFQLSFHKIF